MLNPVLILLVNVSAMRQAFCKIQITNSYVICGLSFLIENMIFGRTIFLNNFPLFLYEHSEQNPKLNWITEY